MPDARFEDHPGVQEEIEELFFQVLEVAASDREEFLARKTLGNERLLKEVRALLAVEDELDLQLRDSPSSPLQWNRREDAGPPDAIGHYVVRGELGRGGMGVVYLAQDTKLDREVAIKGLPSHLFSDQAPMERFLREAKTLALLNHRSIASIYGLEEQGDRRFLVLEYVPGETLRELMGHTRLEVEQVLAIATGLAAAIEYAHDKGVVHCDLKPANVMVSASDEVKVLDFGLARALQNQSLAAKPISGRSPRASDLGSSLAGAIVGTPGYLAPEQVRGESPTRSSDVFSFGVVLYQMLTGVSPFKAETVADSLAATLKSEVNYALLPTELPDPVGMLVRLCLAKTPAKRLQHMGDSRLLLEQALEESREEPRSDAEVKAREPRVERFKITESLCRLLDRKRLDPRLIGYELQYLDNHQRSDSLVFFLHAVGRDQSQWRDHLRALPYRGMAPTQVGFEPKAKLRLQLSIRDHLIVLREFMRAKIAECRPQVTIATAHSAGADLVMRMIAEIEDHEPLPIDGLLPLEPNLGLATCQVTRKMAHFDIGRESETLERLRRLGEVPESLDDWIILYDYLSEIISKFRNDIETLRDFGREIIAPFEGDGPTPFLAWYRAVTAKVPHVRCVFSETPVYHKRILDLRLEHLDNECFGPHHREESIHIERGTTHLDLYQVKRVSRYLHEMVQQISSGAGA